MNRRLQTLVAIAILAAVYLGTGWFGLSLAVIHKSVSAVWPPTGIALVALLIWGYRVWPGIFLGAFLVNLFTFLPKMFIYDSALMSLGMALGNTLEALVGAWLVNRFAGGRNAFDQTRTIFRFIFFAAFASTLLSATIGPAALCIGGAENWNHFAPVWLTWWIGDMVSNIVVAPLLLIWSQRPFPRWKAPQVLEFILLLLTVSFCGQLVFGGWLIPNEHYAIGYMTLPPVLWTGWRFGLRGASAAAIVLSGLAIAGTVQGYGPFAVRNQNESLLLLQSFIAVVTLMAIVLASVLTEREQAQTAGQESQFRLTALVDSAMDGIITMDGEQRIVVYNRAAEVMFGFPSREMIGQPIDRLLPERFRSGHTAHIHSFEKTGVTSRRMGALGAISGRRASGEEFDIEASISQVAVGGQKFFTVILRDITERRKMEDALQVAQKKLEAHAQELEQTVAERTARLREAIADLEAFSYSVSHDLRAPLRVMRQYSETLLQDCAHRIGDEGSEYLQRIATAAARLDELICGVLTYSRVVRSETKFQRVELGKLLEDIIQGYPDLKSHHSRIEIVRPVHSVNGSEIFLTQCLANLLGNAVKFVRPGEAPRIRVWTEAREPNVRVWIEDDGIGIEPQHRSRVFAMFERLHSTREYDGTGIGLAIVRKAAERMGGSVGFESEPGLGTRFWLELPAGA